MAEVLGTGRVARLIRMGDGWEVVQRVGRGGIVAVAASTTEGQVLLVEQWRPPVSALVIELPAGQVDPGEDDVTAAQRELLEETGYGGGNWTLLGRGTSSAGILDEVLVIYQARGVVKREPGGGMDDEEIVVHIVPRISLLSFLRSAEASGRLIDWKVWAVAGLFSTTPKSESD